MIDLIRITTQYVPDEDRVRISSQLADGRVVLLWFTQRLLQRAVPQLVAFLESSGSGAAAKADSESKGMLAINREVVQTFAQKKAQSQLQRQPPVPAAKAEESWLVHAVDLRIRNGVILMVFRNGGNSARLALSIDALRQWLDIVYGQYCLAGWSVSVWPSWIIESKRDVTEQGSRGNLH